MTSWVERLTRGGKNYLLELKKINNNVRMIYASAALVGMAYGIYGVVFNLYVLSLGHREDMLGRILSAGPFAHIFAAIPFGFMAELIGFKKAFLFIYSVYGASLLVQFTVPDVTVMTIATFVAGLAVTGNFVVRLPFLSANSQGSERAHVFSLDTLIFYMTTSIGAILGGYLPAMLSPIIHNESVQYRVVLWAAGILILLSLLPVMFIQDLPVIRKKISLKPYLWGIDRFTIEVAIVELFLGLMVGLIVPFMNLYFVKHLKTSLEFYGSVEALALIPIILATALAPALARRYGAVRSFVVIRFLIPVIILVMGITLNPLVGALAYWGYKVSTTISQPLWFDFAMTKASISAKNAVSAWLEITFNLGMGIAALVTGNLLSQSNYVLPFFICAVAALLTALSTLAFTGFGKPRKENAEVTL